MYRHFGSRKRRANSSATAIPSSVGAAKCVPSAARSRTAAVIAGCACPCVIEPKPLWKSRYSVPSTSQTRSPSPCVEVDRPRLAQLVRGGDAAGERLPRALVHRLRRARALVEPRALPLDQLADAGAVDLDGRADDRHPECSVGTTRTGNGDRWTSRSTTDPRIAPVIGLSPTVPTTIALAPTSFATSISASAGLPETSRDSTSTPAASRSATARPTAWRATLPAPPGCCRAEAPRAG